MIKSYQEFVYQKSPRGRAFTDFPLDNNFFVAHDINSITTQPSPDYLRKLDNEISGIEQIIKDTWLKTLHTHRRQQDLPLDEWSSPQAGVIDSIEFTETGLIRVFGWALPWKTENASTIKTRINASDWLFTSSFTRFLRPDVLKHYPEAPENCGFIALIEGDFSNSIIEHIEIRAIDHQGIATEPIALGALVLEMLKDRRRAM